MDDEIKKLKKKISEVFDADTNINEDSDIPVHEKRVKEKKLREIFRR